MPCGEGGHVRLAVTLSDGARALIPLATLARFKGGWQWSNIRECVRTPTIPDDSALVEQYLQHPFVATESLGATLGVMRPQPPPPLLPEPVVILVAVYRGAKFLPAFFESLLANTRSPYHLILVDDGNTDGAISAHLRALAAAHRHISLIRIPVNNGYISAMREAIKHAPPGHIVTLNTDIVLPDYWLERLMWPMFRDPSVASCTPFTNAGTSCSFPRIAEDNPLYLGLPVAEIDKVFNQVVGEEANITIPSGVGFCMAMNRRVVEDIGWFDEAAFGHGYGEENDWCLRAGVRGYRNIQIANLFVYHKHGGSFLSDEKKVLMANSLRIINERFPAYDNQIVKFFGLDPLAPIRALVAFLIAAHRAGAVDVIFDHDLGGGSRVTREERSARLFEEGIPHILVLPGADAEEITIVLRAPGIAHAYHTSTWADLGALIARVRGRRILINNLAHWDDPIRLAGLIEELLTVHGFALEVLAHDFFFACPSHNLLGADDRFCHLPDIEVCSHCASRNRNFLVHTEAAEKISIPIWRAVMGRLLARADRVTCFSRSSARLLQKAYPDLPTPFVLPHFLTHFHDVPQLTPDAGHGLVIGVLGNLNVAKGARLVRGLAAAIQRAGSAARLVVLGALAPETNPNLAAQEFSAVSGYNHATLPAMLAAEGVNFVFLPSIWPETFSFVAEEVMALGLPLAAFDLGAPAERIRLYERGVILPFCEGNKLLEMLERSYGASCKTLGRLAANFS